MTKILTGTLVAALLTGCGLSNTAGDTVSDGAVSGSAVSGDAVAPQNRKVKDQADKDETTATEVKNCLANDDNRYGIGYNNDGDPFLRQTRLDGSHKKKIEIKDIESVCWVTNEWVYYIASKEGDEKATLYRIPIKKTEQGDSLLLKRKEVVVTENYVDDLYVTDTYIIYCTCDDKYRDRIYKLDLRTKEKKNLLLAEDADDIFGICYMWGKDEDDEKRFPLMKSGKLFFCSEDKVWLLDPETEEVKQLASGDWFWHEVKQGKIWFVGDESIYWYDEKKEEVVCVLSREQLRELLVQEGILGNKQSKRKVEIYETWYYQGRFYLEVYWYDKKLETDVLLSFSLQNPEDIRNERTASDFIRKYNEKEYFYEEVYGVKDGKMLMGFWAEGDEEDFYAVYDLDTKRIRRIREKEAERLFPDLAE